MKGDEAMLSSAKPTTSAFILREDKVEEFLASRDNSGKKALERYKKFHKESNVVESNKK